MSYTWETLLFLFRSFWFPVEQILANRIQWFPNRTDRALQAGSVCMCVHACVCMERENEKVKSEERWRRLCKISHAVIAVCTWLYRNCHQWSRLREAPIGARSLLSWVQWDSGCLCLGELKPHQLYQTWIKKKNSIQTVKDHQRDTCMCECGFVCTRMHEWSLPWSWLSQII